VEINATTLALDAIAGVEPGKGFLAERHTLKNWRWAQWRPELIDHSRYNRWVEEGSKDAFTRANERARGVLATHQLPALPALCKDPFQPYSNPGQPNSTAIQSVP